MDVDNEVSTAKKNARKTSRQSVHKDAEQAQRVRSVKPSKSAVPIKPVLVPRPRPTPPFYSAIKASRSTAKKNEDDADGEDGDNLPSQSEAENEDEADGASQSDNDSASPNRSVELCSVSQAARDSRMSELGNDLRAGAAILSEPDNGLTPRSEGFVRTLETTSGPIIRGPGKARWRELRRLGSSKTSAARDQYCR
ncbi:hypothetical protein GGX14DRAFT_407933 [Mycena pura]|uniref:Uncharacterized protein n=1 Tax=Mycena pura TaxID=153505 RepID=A0AAD6URJ2_9AGAR|nr:hypothetical protein GGX14DRAFT_407933 [Mycena pura]